MKTLKHLIGIVFGASIALCAHATTLNPVQLLNPAGSTSGQAVVSTGAGTTPAWGNVAATALAAQAANTVVANVTASSASPTAFAMPSCSGATNALTYTTSTGFTCNSSVNAAMLGGATFASPGAIGSTTASTGKFTTLQATSTITPSSTAGIVGTATNDNAQAGSIGEYISSTSTSTTLTSGTAANLTSISLTAGDWDVQVETVFTGGTPTFVQTGMSTTSVTYDTTIGRYGTFNSPSGTPLNGGVSVTTAASRYQLTSTTTIFLVASSIFTGTETATGIIRARRPR